MRRERPPSDRPLKLPAVEIEYRPAKPSDAEAIASLHARSWRENYRGAVQDAFLDGDLPGERLRVWRESCRYTWPLAELLSDA